MIDALFGDRDHHIGLLMDSSKVGLLIGELAARHLKPALLELGENRRCWC